MKYLLFSLLLLTAVGTVNLSGQSINDFSRMAKAKMDIGDYKSAADDFSSIIRLQPNYEVLYQAYYGRGYAKFQMGNFKAAKTDFDRAIKIYPNDAEVYFWRAYTKYKLRDKASSEIADYNRAILLRPEYPEAFFNRGLAKIKNRQQSSGCNDLKKALELGYQDAELQLRLHCGTTK
jgi:tetratricopeptide (TPR) repeat protein